MSMRTYVWGAVLLSLAAILAMLITGTRPAHADGCWDIDGCPRRHRAVKHHRNLRHYSPPKWEDRRDRDDDEDREERRTCLEEKVRGLGTQWIGTEGALSAAKKDWMERVRYDHGETFVDITHSLGFESRCGRVSIGEVAGQVTYRCEIVARPCKAVFSEGRKPTK